MWSSEEFVKENAEGAQEEAAPAEEVFSSQATRCVKRVRQTEKGGGGMQESKGGCSSCMVQRERSREREREHSGSQLWERGKKEKQWKA